MTEPTNEQLLAWLKGVENDLEGVNMMLPKIRKIYEKRDMKMLSTLRRLIINQPNVERLAEAGENLTKNRRLDFGAWWVGSEKELDEFTAALAAYRAGEKA